MQGNHKEQTRSARRKRRVEERSFKVLEILEWARLLFFGFLLAFILRSFVLEFVRVDGPSMQNTLQSHEFVMFTKSDFAFDYPDRGAVVVCRYPGREDYIVKRVVGLPGDTVEIRDKRLYVNGARIDEPYIEYLPEEDFAKTVVPQNSVFVLGDNRTVSHDSRAADVGPLPKDYIIGNVRFVVWPLSDWRRVTFEIMEVPS